MKKQLLFVIIASLSGCASTATTPTPDSKPAAKSEPVRYLFKTTPELTIKAEEIVKQQLKDPSSAQFRNAFITTPADDTSQISYCGEVNAKNAYGGYTGFKPFFVDFENGPIFGTPETPGVSTTVLSI